MTGIDRFKENYIPEPNSGCWLWIGALRPTGYGVFNEGGKRYPAHRWGYESLVGQIPKGLQIDHLCRVRSCVNPDHLEPVTQRENILRGNGIAAINARKTHCKRGHPLTAGNVYLSAKRRQCRQCTIELGRQRKKQNRRKSHERRRRFIENIDLSAVSEQQWRDLLRLLCRPRRRLTDVDRLLATLPHPTKGDW